MNRWYTRLCARVLDLPVIPEKISAMAALAEKKSAIVDKGIDKMNRYITVAAFGMGLGAMAALWESDKDLRRGLVRQQ